MIRDRLGRPGFRWLLLLVIALGSWTCGEVPASSEPTGPEPTVLEAGDGLLDLLPLSHFAVDPGAGVPDAFRAPGPQGFVLRTPVIPAGAWRALDRPPDAWAEVLARNGGPTLWRAELPARLAPGTRPLRVLVGGTEPPVWSPDVDPMPERWAWWDPVFSMVFAVGATAPTDVSLDVPVDPVAELGPLMPFDPSPRGHVRRRELGDVTRPALLMPPPGALELHVDELRAERLHLSLGLLDRAWALFDDAFHRTTGRSDGARFVVEVSDETGTARVFERTLTRDDVGRGWVDAVVDLSAYRGRAITLRLATEPGDDGDALFDWALWGDLRLRGGPHPAPQRPHVVLIHVDTLRADRVGGVLGRTPRIDAWAAAHALRFDDVVAPASWTLPSTVSMLTGLAVHQHGVERHGQTMDGSAHTLAERLSDAGYETWGLAAGGYLRPSFGMDQGFDRYETAAPENLDWSSALTYLARRDSARPLFLFLHTYHVHAPYPHDPACTPPDYHGQLAGQAIDYANVIDPYREGALRLGPADLAYVTSQYDSQVRSMDASIGALLEQLERDLADEGLLVVLTSDHGEAFGEHGVLEHGQALWQELLRVPLLLRLPDGRPGRRSDPASLIDVVPTVLELLGLPGDAALAGSSLLSVQPDERVRAARLRGAGLELTAVLSSGLKLLEDGAEGATGSASWTLFDLRADPGERTDLVPSLPRRAEALWQRGQAFEQTWPAPLGGLSGETELADDVASQLRALGYLGDG